MLGLFSNVQNVFKAARNLKKVQIDNGALRLQYRVTTTILLIATIVVCAQNYIGKNIDCIQSSSAIPQNVLNTYCFFIGTYSVIRNDTEYPFPGINPDGPDATSYRHLWYQWVPFYLTFLAIMYYSAHFLWKTSEKQTLKSVLVGLEFMRYSVCDSKVGDIPSQKEREKFVNELAEFLHKRMKAKMHHKWAIKLLACEIFAMCVAGFCYWLTDIFVGGQGQFVNLNLQTAPVVFPTMTKCMFHKYGPSGTIQKHDALCVLALNIVNEKLFYFLHFWLPFILAVSVAAVIWRIASIFLYSNLSLNKFLLRVREENLMFESDRSDPRQKVLKAMKWPDWLFFRYLARNSSRVVLEELFNALAQCIENDEGTDDDHSVLLPATETKQFGKDL